jgi:hypothetical protein
MIRQIRKPATKHTPRIAISRSKLESDADASTDPTVEDLQRFDIVYDVNGKSSGLPGGMLFGHTHVRASSEHEWDPMASSRCKVLSENAHRARPWWTHDHWLLEGVGC